MAWTSIGFDGTINEAQWSQMSTLMGSSGGGYLAAGNGDCLATAVGGSRAVSVAAGSLYGDGIVSTNSGAETVAMTTPVNGQWYVIALRRTWATNTAALVAIAGATTTTTTPTAPPTSFPTLNTNQGVLTDQPIAWAWCNSANTTVVVYDIRLKGIKSTPPVVANQGERDAKFMSPTQGLQVWRDDLGAVETYFGLYNVSTNPGGRDAAGWYVTNRSSAMVPVKPSSITVVSGSGTVNALGSVNFTNATSVLLEGVFTSAYKNYKVVVKTANSGNGANYYLRVSASGTEKTSGYYSQTYRFTTAGASGITADTGGFLLGPMSSFGNYFASDTTVYSPFASERTQVSGTADGEETTTNNYTFVHGGGIPLNDSYTGVKFYATTTSGLTGTITVYGLNY